MNKVSLVGMRLPEKYKENFDVSTVGSGIQFVDRIQNPDKGIVSIL